MQDDEVEADEEGLDPCALEAAQSRVSEISLAPFVLRELKFN